MNKSVIVMTYLGLESAVSAAMVLNCFKDAELMISSSSKFIKHLLENLLNIKNKHIIIIGLDTNGSSIDLFHLYKKILFNKNKITWIHGHNITDEFLDFFESSENIEVISEKEMAKNIADLTYSYIVDNCKDVNLADLSQIKEFQKDLKSIEARLVEYSIFRFFNFSDYNAFPTAIKKISKLPVKISKNDIPKDFENFRVMYGASEETRKLKDRIKKIANSNFKNLLVIGETGTGKELVARHVHFLSDRLNKPFEIISCPNIKEELFESELFGYEKGAFTGADKYKEGVLSRADGGTVFLDEIGNISLDFQSKLLRFIQEQTFKPLNAIKEKKVDVRLIFATNRNLQEMVLKNEFREDLYYRINQIRIDLPPLRERLDDIDILYDIFLYRDCIENDGNFWKISSEKKKHIFELKKYSWPGNIRELENALKKALIYEEFDFSYLKNENRILFKEEKKNFKKEKFKEETLTLKEMKEEYIKKILEKNEFNIKKTARILDIAPNTVRKYL
ncbi:MAG: sigma-54 dependent transcriptional regulator [Candidatus Muirbacterium halophilum]|nr:sigma-54 dependent transcriptional regulator [Candidatus Muirbacterium halophilum]MCK9474476.1 sigma-54 dependent transcriptional regulator [Candidatus Muirbacterium halophilum]